MVYLFVDTETTGTNYIQPTGEYRENQLLQIAYELWNNNLGEKLARGNFYVKLDVKKAVSDMNEFVLNMHTKTGLIDILKTEQTETIDFIDARISEILEQYSDERITLVGNNVYFDHEVLRRYLPQTFKHLHYGLLDVSSLRKLCDILGSDYGRLLKAQKKSNHDAQIDIKECVKELKNYLSVMRNGLFEAGEYTHPLYNWEAHAYEPTIEIETNWNN